jgi:hypothetical protein
MLTRTRIAAAAVFFSSFAALANAGAIVFTGSVTQSPFDASQQALNNPSLNGIFDFQAYSVTFTFDGSIVGPGTYNGLTGSALTFSVPSALASEAAFDVVYLSITANGNADDFSLLGCLTSGSGCFQGNQLDASFEIPMTGLNSQGVTATGLDQPHPLDLLEDDGDTEVQGIITTYSYTQTATSTPEPAPVGPCSLVLAGLVTRSWKSIHAIQKGER